ncbi:Glucan endo-1,3-beta-glucosidase 11 [Acorus gramineus]|uniref:Glucan endo-1,3-beta-glucosidase 11 n=1 Tax=Acorus gramineus TaxID=55184 RepID=A0AAV9AZW4_ACOGR|nr:Glucan endo-1,3-beta-glucosidase 11 [Acorus gramineus]
MGDPDSRLHYDNILYAQVDVVVFLIGKLGFRDVDVRVSETGWPSKGDPDEVRATVENDETYKQLRPNQRLEVYLFAMFNEDMKPEPTSERNYDLYRPEGTMAYNVGLAKCSLASPIKRVLLSYPCSLLALVCFRNKMII